MCQRHHDFMSKSMTKKKVNWSVVFVKGCSNFEVFEAKITDVL